MADIVLFSPFYRQQLLPVALSAIAVVPAQYVQ